VQQRIAPSVQIEAAIEAALAGGLGDPDALSTLGRLGAQLVLQRAVEDELATFLARARYQRTPDAAGSRNGHRPRRVQTAEGEITVAVPQVRATLTRFVSSVIPDTRSIIRTRPLEALVIGAYVRGLSDRDIESLAREAGLGAISRTAVSGVCRELRDRYRAFRARSLAEVRLLAMFMDAIYLPVRPDGPKEGVLVAWGFTTDGERVLLDVSLGQRERTEAWTELGRGCSVAASAARSSSSPTGHLGSSGQSTSCGPTPTVVGALSTGDGICSPSCPTGLASTPGSGRRTGPRSTGRPPLTKPSMACGCSSASSRVTSRPRRRVSPTISRP